MIRKILPLVLIGALLMGPVAGVCQAEDVELQDLMGADEKSLREHVERLEESASDSLSELKRNKLLGVAYHNLGVKGVKGQSKKAVKHLEKAAEAADGNPEVTAFLGSAWTLRGRDAKGPVEKVNYTNKGIKLLDKGVEKAPKNVLVRILRINNSLGLPSFFGRGDLAKSDIDFLLDLEDKAPEKFTRSRRVALYKAAAEYYQEQENYSMEIQFWEKVAETADGDAAETARDEIAKLEQLVQEGGGLWWSVLIIYVPAGLATVVVLAVLYFFVYVPYFENVKRRELGKYRFEKVETAEEREKFYDFLKKEFIPESVPEEPEKRQEFIEGIKEDDAVYEDSMTRIMGYHGGKPVCALLLVEQPHEAGLMYDYQDKFDFSSLTDRGKIMEVGRLCIDSEYRHNPSLLQGILCWVVELAMKKRGLFLLVSALRQDQPLYQKLGFEIMEGCTQVDEKFGTEKVMVLNIPAFLEEEKYSEGMESGVRLSVSVPYILRFIVFRMIFQDKTVAEMDVTGMGEVKEEAENKQEE